MSVGHRHGYKHSAALEKETNRLLDTPRVKSYLGRQFYIDTSHKIPLTGGSSKDGVTYFLDPSVPKDLRPFVLWHERTEKAFRATLGMSYARAHELATCAEKMMVERHGRSWELYKRQIAGPVRQDEQEHVKLPPDLDRGPYRESGIRTN